MAHDDRTAAERPGDDEHRERRATARAILQCLVLLFDEASALHLPRTVEALHQALDACRDETATHLHRNDDAAANAPPEATIH